MTTMQETRLAHAARRPLWLSILAGFSLLLYPLWLMPVLLFRRSLFVRKKPHAPVPMNFADRKG
jgi:hypothetical protein